MLNNTNREINFDTSKLISKYLLDTLTTEESQRLNDWLSEEKNMILFEKVKAKETILKKIETYQNEDVEAAFNQFVQKRKKKSLARIYKRVLIAASILLPIIYFIPKFMFVYKNTEQALVNTNTNTQSIDLTKPRLTLADSSQVILGEVAIDAIKDIHGLIAGEDGYTLDYSNMGRGASNVPQYNLLEIPATYTYQLVLSDGSKVWLNSESTLRYPVKFGAQDRTVEAAGELFFEVKKDNERPFYVITDGVKVKVTGTKFNVKNYKNDNYSSVTLAEGGVTLLSKVGTHKLVPSKQFKINNENNQYSINTVNLEEYISWKDGLYIFKNKNLDEVMKITQRWFGMEVMYINPSSRLTKFTGVLHKDEKIDQFIQRLESTSKLRFKKGPKQLAIF